MLIYSLQIRILAKIKQTLQSGKWTALEFLQCMLCLMFASRDSDAICPGKNFFSYRFLPRYLELPKVPNIL